MKLRILQRKQSNGVFLRHRVWRRFGHWGRWITVAARPSIHISNGWGGGIGLSRQIDNSVLPLIRIPRTNHAESIKYSNKYSYHSFSCGLFVAAIVEDALGRPLETSRKPPALPAPRGDNIGAEASLFSSSSPDFWGPWTCSLASFLIFVILT